MGCVIAVAGKGGTGKTTLAGLIVRHLVQREKGPVLAIDADANDNLAEELGMRAEKSIAGVTDSFFKDRVDLPSGMPKEAYLEIQLNTAIVESKDIDLLVMGHPEGAGCYCYVNNILRAHMEQLVNNYPYVVIDNEAGMEHVSRRTTRKMDHLLLVANYSAKAVRAAGRIRQVAQELDLVVGEAGLIINQAPADISPLHELIDNMGLKLWQIVPLSDRVLQNDVVGKSVFSLPDDDPAVIAAGALVDKLTGR